MCKVSVIVPVYNVENYLSKCLESIVNQTLKDIEIICIDDGSTDKSCEILNVYAEKDKRIKIITQENKGVSAARNKGIDVANGEFIGFIDSDDWIDLDFFEKLYKAAFSTQSDIAVAGMKKGTSRKFKTILKFDEQLEVPSTDKKFEICDIPDSSYVWNKIYRLSEINKHNLRFKEGIVYEDVIFSPRIISKLGRLVVVPDTYYYYLKRKGSIVNTNKRNNDYNSAQIEAEKIFEDCGLDINEYRTINRRYKFLGITVFRIKRKRKMKKVILFGALRWHIA